MDVKERLDDTDAAARLAAARELGEAVWRDVAVTDEVNNHVHTFYSFSPYSPCRAAVKAAQAGLRAVGIMDHDSVAGCAEMWEAGKALALATTSGCEIRVNMTGTRVAGRKTNNPDEPSVSYIALHGIPAPRRAEVKRFLAPIQAARLRRDRAETDRLNAWLAARGAATLDFDRDVWTVSRAAEGGSVTERHILYALARRLIAQWGAGAALLDDVRDRLGLAVSPAQAKLLADPQNPHYAYDLLGVFKSALVPEFFIPSGTDECGSVFEAVRFANDIGAIPAYAYLGDVGESPTGDKKAEKFEDDFLDELVPELVRIGFRAITYMPPRNTVAQLRRVRALCAAHGLMEISGVDINSSRQSFRCPILLEPEFRHLVDATWALIAHEKLASIRPERALFHPRNPRAGRPLAERLAAYAEIGRRLDPRRPEAAPVED